MENKERLPQRVAMARYGAKFCTVLKRDRLGRARTLLVPGSEAKQYRVIVRRYAGLVTTECALDTGIGHQDCPGNSNGHVCYHSFQALHKAGAEAKARVSLCATEKDAKLVARLGGAVVRVRSHQGKGELWAVVK